jgi:hypothetical protein
MRVVECVFSKCTTFPDCPADFGLGQPRNPSHRVISAPEQVSELLIAIRTDRAQLPEGVQFHRLRFLIPL